MTKVICPECKEKQESMFDKTYTQMHGHCWDEDRKVWLEGKLPIKEFEQREQKVLNKFR